MKAILWPYRYADLQGSWAPRLGWVVKALQDGGVEVKRHPDFHCNGLEALPLYDYHSDNPADICIYNHATEAELTGNVLKTRANWFFKPTIPTERHATLDTMGYGPHSSITFTRPIFESVQAKDLKSFYDVKVKGWIEGRATKWGTEQERLVDMSLPSDIHDYWLVLGQCAGDSVVTRMDFGGYVAKLLAVVAELLRVSPQTVVIKLHPWMNGMASKETPGFAEDVKKRLEALDPKRVRVFNGKSNVHGFLPGARAVLLANSGAGFEAMMHRKPIIAWGCPEYRWVAYDLRLLSMLRRAVRLDWFNPIRQAQFLYWYCEKYCLYDEASASRRVEVLLGGR